MQREQMEGEGRPRILAVDDDPQDLRYVRDTLVKSGYDPVLTGDAGGGAPPRGAGEAGARAAGT